MLLFAIWEGEKKGENIILMVCWVKRPKWHITSTSTTKKNKNKQKKEHLNPFFLQMCYKHKYQHSIALWLQHLGIRKFKNIAKVFSPRKKKQLHQEQM